MHCEFVKDNLLSAAENRQGSLQALEVFLSAIELLAIFRHLPETHHPRPS
jgi:hypothetical protein